MNEENPGHPPGLAHLEKLSGNPRELLNSVRAVIAEAMANFEPTDLKHSLQYLDSTVGFLRKDSDRCFSLYADALKRWRDTSNQEIYEEFQFYLRQMIRTFFAEVDGTLYAIRQVILWAHGRGEFNLTSGEIAVLREETYKFNVRTREVEAKSSFNNTKETFVLAFTFLPRLLNPAFILDLSSDGWECFQKLLEVRHELTHPKETLKQLVDTDVITVKLPRARIWYYESLKSAVRAESR